MILFPPPFYFVFDISNLLSYIQNNFSYELARPIMGTIFLVMLITVRIEVAVKLLVKNGSHSHDGDKHLTTTPSPQISPAQCLEIYYIRECHAQ